MFIETIKNCVIATNKLLIFSNRVVPTCSSNSLYDKSYLGLENRVDVKYPRFIGCGAVKFTVLSVFVLEM